MTEGARKHGIEKPMCVRIWLEVGHACEPRRSALGRALTLDWRVWVRGDGGGDISAFVHKVVFYLHPASAFVYPKRVIQAPPYEIQESGCASIEIPIHVYLKHSSRPKRIRLRYSLHVENTAKSSQESCRVFYDVESPDEALRRALVSCGGQTVSRPASPPRPPLPPPPPHPTLALLPSDDDARASPSPKPQDIMRAKRYKFVEPINPKDKEALKKTPKSQETCVKCGKASLQLQKQLKNVAMMDDEIERVQQLYLSYRRYEKSPGALILPPLSDPIYRVPELPGSLKTALSSVEADYAMQ